MTGGPERRDESVNFSLAELMKLEDERIAQEKRAHEARQLAAQSEREAAERRESETVAARARAEAEERERLRFREMEEEARREAMQRAAVEQARITVEARTRADESERERRHEIELQRMRAETIRKPGPGGFVASGIGGAAFAFAACLVLHFAVSKPASDRRIADLDRAIATERGRSDELGRRIDDEKTRIAGLERDLGDARNEITRLRAPPPVKATPLGPHPGGGNVPTKSNKPGTGINEGPPCAPFDPLCFRIDRK